MTGAQTNAIADFNSTLDLANNVGEIAKKINTGPIAGRIGKAAQWTGGATTGFVELNTNIANLKSSFMKTISGATISDREVERLSQFLPDVNDPEEVLQIKIKNLKEGIERNRDSLYEATGGNNPYGTSGPSQQAMISVYDVNTGEAGQIPENEFNSSQYIKR